MLEGEVPHNVGFPMSRSFCLVHTLTSSSGKKEQASHCCTADVCLCQSVNQLYNNPKMAKLVLFSTRKKLKKFRGILL